jgi:hypothetical protein
LRIRLSSLFAFLIVLLTITGVSPFSSIRTSTTLISWLLIASLYVIVAALLSSKASDYYSRIPYKEVIIAYGLWVMITAARGALVADNYWEYKFLITNTGAILMPLMIWTLASPKMLEKILKYWMWIALPLFAVFYFLLSKGSYGFYLAPLVLFLLLLPNLSAAQKGLVLIFFAIVVFSSLDGRANILRFSFPLIFASLFLFRNVLGPTLLRGTTLCLFVLPPLLAFLGQSGTFNIFKTQDYLTSEALGLDQSTVDTITADTRTALYDEVWTSAVRNDYVWQGRTPARGYDSNIFGKHIAGETGSGKRERNGGEVGVHSIFTWLGAIGLALYSALFFVASKLAVMNSNNFSVKLVGLYVAFRWAFCWVEEFIGFNVNYFVLWMLVAICFSPEFRKMTDKEIGEWLRNIVPGNNVGLSRARITSQ